MDARHLVRHAARTARIGLVAPLNVTLHTYGGTDKWQHGYGPHYAEHFRPWRLKARRVLEVGVGGYDSAAPGGSLRVWRDYFPRARVVGLDLFAKDVRLGERVGFVQGDQTSPTDLDAAVVALGGAPDIVIDDGSHMAEHGELTFTHLFPIMPPGGCYVIEDLHTSYWPSFGGGIPAPDAANTRFVERLVDSVQRADPTFVLREGRADRPAPPGRDDVAAVDVRPGLVFIIRR